MTNKVAKKNPEKITILNRSSLSLEHVMKGIVEKFDFSKKEESEIYTEISNGTHMVSVSIALHLRVFYKSKSDYTFIVTEGKIPGVSDRGCY